MGQSRYGPCCKGAARPSALHLTTKVRLTAHGQESRTALLREGLVQPRGMSAGPCVLGWESSSTGRCRMAKSWSSAACAAVSRGAGCMRLRVLGDGQHGVVPHGEAGRVPRACNRCRRPAGADLAAVAVPPEVTLDVSQPRHNLLEGGPAHAAQVRHASVSKGPVWNSMLAGLAEVACMVVMLACACSMCTACGELIVELQDTCPSIRPEIGGPQKPALVACSANHAGVYKTRHHIFLASLADEMICTTV